MSPKQKNATICFSLLQPNERKRVTLVALSGERIVYGGNGWIDGKLDEENKQAALGKLA